jgi:UDP-glucose 4-epimerase
MNSGSNNDERRSGDTHVLVTGGAGFIGSHLVERHLAQGHRVHVIDDLSTGTQANVDAFAEHPRFRFTQADVLTWDGLDKAVGWADRIYHMAAVVGMFRVLEDPIRVLAVNIAGCERVLRAAKAGKWRPQVVIASSSEVYGQGNDNHFQEDAQVVIESAANVRWNYAVSKLADEVFGLSYARETNGLPVVIARLFNTVGSRQSGRYGMVIPRFVAQAVAGDAMTVFGDGTQSRCFCDVRDTVAALDALAGNEAAHGQIVNVGNRQEITINDLATKVRALAQSESPVIRIPYREAYGADFEDVHRRSATFEKLRTLTGLEPQWPLDATLAELIAARRAAAGSGQGH